MLCGDLNGKEIPKRVVYVYISLIHFAVQLKLTQHYKAAMSEGVSEIAQLCLTFCNPMDCSPPGSSIHGILQARILEWVAIALSRGSS